MNKFELRLVFDGISPTQSMEIETQLKSEFKDIRINTLSKIGSSKGIGDFGIVGASTVISAVVSVILLIWTIKLKKDKSSIKEGLKKSKFEIEEKYVDEITKIYSNNGGEMKITINKEKKYRLRIIKDEDVMTIMGRDNN